MFIVLEGLDGAGKSTQIRMLQELFARRGVACRYLHFPRFDAPVFGDLIARFLRGELGTVEAVDPYLVALLFAGDRGDAAAEIRQWLASGEAVVLDRYVYSNVAFQCAKLSSEEERRALKRWILDTEYGYYRLPRPDVSLFLDVPFSFTERKLTQAREGGVPLRDLGIDLVLVGGQVCGSGLFRGVVFQLCGRPERDLLDLQQRVRGVYLDAAREDAAFRVVDCCAPDGSMETPERIFSKIEAALAPLLNAAADA